MAILKLEPQSANSQANFTFGNVTANFFIGNGSQLTGLPAGYANSDVANYLPNYTGSMTFSNANIHISGGASGQYLQTNGSGGLSWASPSGSGSPGGSNTQIQFNDAGTLGGSVGFTFDKTTGVLTAGNITTTTVLSVGANATVTGNAIVGADLYVGTGATTTGLSNPTIIAKDSAATYIQIGAVNSSNAGSADFAAYGDNGTDAAGWVDMGFTGSNFSDANYTITGKNDGYIFANAVTGTGLGGNLVFATGSGGANKDIVFATGGYLAANEKIRFQHSLGTFNVKTTTAATSTTTGAIITAGGAGVAGNLYIGGIANVTGNVSAGNVITSGIFYPNGVAYSTGGGGPGTYGDSNVVTLLGTFGSNIITTTGNITGGNVIAGTGSSGNISGANVISSNAFQATSQVTLGSVVAGQIDSDGTAVYIADNTTSGRGLIQPVQAYRYTTTGAATATTITDYFPASTSLNLEANSIYDIDAHCYFLKTTAGTATWTWAFSSGVSMARSYYVSSIITGFTTTTVVGAPVTGMAVAQGGAVTTLAHAASGSLTTGVYHSFHFKLFLVTNAACNIRLRVTNSAGTITPQTGSFYSVRKLSANAGIFVA